MAHMGCNKFFSVHQFGLRRGHMYSCVTHLLQIFEEWSKDIDDQNAVDAIYLEFMEAFDTVPH